MERHRTPSPTTPSSADTTIPNTTAPDTTAPDTTTPDTTTPDTTTPDTTTPDTTADLVARAQRGDKNALQTLISRHLPALRAYVRLRSNPLLRARESASDLVQSTCREVCASLGELEFRDAQAFRGWLFTLAFNKIQSRHRHHLADKRHPKHEAVELDGDVPVDLYTDSLSPSGKAALREQAARLEAAFDRLPEDHREILALARFAQLSHEAIAERLGRSPKACRNLLHRAMVRLTSELRALERLAAE